MRAQILAVAGVALATALPSLSAAQSRVYLARTESCAPACTGAIAAIDPAGLTVESVITVPVEIDSQPYLTPDGRLLIWYAGVFSGGPYRLVVFDLGSRALTVLPWAAGPPGVTLGNSQRAEIYVTAGQEALAVFEGGTRVVSSPAECSFSRQPSSVSADGRRLIASCVSVDGLPHAVAYVVDIEGNRVVWQSDPSGPVGGLYPSADGQDVYRVQGSLITAWALDDGHDWAQVTGPFSNHGNYLHVDPGTGRVVAIGMLEAATYEPRTLQTVATWPVPWSVPVLTTVASVAFDGPTGRLFMASGSQPAAAGTPFGEYHVLDPSTGAVHFWGSAGARGMPDVGWFIAAPAPPSPSALTIDVQGGEVSLSWTPGGAPATTTRYVLEAGSAPGRNDIISGLDVGLQPSFAASGVPPGMYYVRVRAGNFTGLSAPSNDVVVQVP